MRYRLLLILISACQIILFCAGYSYTFNFIPTAFRISRKSSRFSTRLSSATTAKTMSSDRLEQSTDCDQQPQVYFQSSTDSEQLSLFDAHCHLQLSDNDAGIDSLLSSHHIALMATRPDDWERTLRICERHPTR